MDLNSIVSVVLPLAAAAGGLWGGKRIGSGQAVSTAVDTVSLLQVQVSSLTEKNSEKDGQITELRTRIEILENLVTQRAEVEAVHTEVTGVREVVERIAIKVGA